MVSKYPNLWYQVFQFTSFSSPDWFLINNPDIRVTRSITTEDFPMTTPRCPSQYVPHQCPLPIHHMQWLHEKWFSHLPNHILPRTQTNPFLLYPAKSGIYAIAVHESAPGDWSSLLHWCSPASIYFFFQTSHRIPNLEWQQSLHSQLPCPCWSHKERPILCRSNLGSQVSLLQPCVRSLKKFHHTTATFIPTTLGTHLMASQCLTISSSILIHKAFRKNHWGYWFS